MKNTMCFPSYTEFIQRSEMMRSRQERLIQVRQREKQMAAEFLDKMKDQAQRQYENTEKFIMNEISELHSKELAAMRRVYEECITKINKEHYSNVIQPKGTHSRTNTHLANFPKNLLSKKNSSPVKTIIICEDSGKVENKDLQKQCRANNESKQQERNLSPVKKTSNPKIVSRNQSPVKKTSNPRILKDSPKRVETRTTSVYHEKCVPDLKSRTSPKKKLFSVKSIQTTPNLMIINENHANKVTNPILKSFVQKSTEDFLTSYTQRVHDRIRILEQKEKMLHRRAIFLPEFNRLAITQHKKDSATNTDDKVTIEEPKSTESLEPVTVQPSKSVSPNKKVLDIIPKEVRSTAVQTSQSSRKKKRRCKRASLTKNEDMIIFIRNHQDKINDVINDKSSRDVVVEQMSVNTSRETQSSVSEPENISLSVKKIVRTTANEFREGARFRKLDNWRKIFRNGEKLSESSYYSPPDPSIKVPLMEVKNKKKKCKRHLMRKSIANGSEKDIGYYVAKLLLMSPESMENLNNISEETVTSISVDEVVYEGTELARSEMEDEDESIDEEEFIRRMLTVNIPKQPTAESRDAQRKDTAPFRDKSSVSVSTEKSTNTEPDVKSGTSSMTLSGHEDTEGSKITEYNDDDVLKDLSIADLKLDSSLTGWIGASIRRTMEASAVNSTSSYDEYDNLRQVNQLVRSLIEKNEYSLSSENSSSSSAQFLFSPVAIPDIHLNIPQVSETST